MNMIEIKENEDWKNDEESRKLRDIRKKYFIRKGSGKRKEKEWKGSVYKRGEKFRSR